ncbi:NUDIX domain-containing protein [Streptomyces sp. NPDC020799]|uniref:NUDIX domain-containing protein n=1 Tax=Streptomyces sp. NPDC020799 TaxID=3365091 RepID=UPI00379E642C
MTRQWTDEADRAAAWDAHLDLVTWPPCTGAAYVEAPSQILDSAARIDRHLSRTIAETLCLPLAQQIIQGREVLAPVLRLREQLDEWKRAQPQPLAGDEELAWPGYPALTSAEQEAGRRLRQLADLLGIYARTGQLHEPGQGWVRLGTDVLHDGRFLRLHRDQVIQPDGDLGTYDHVTVRDGARVVAVDPAGRVALVEDASYLHGRLLFLPGGGITPGEDPETAARRECEEETGWRPGNLRLLSVFHPMTAVTATTTRLYLSTDLEQGQLRRDPTEVDMIVKWLPLEKAVRSVEEGVISEAGSALGILLAARALAP